MLRPRMPNKADTTTQPKKAIRDELTNPRPAENSTGLTNLHAHILDNPPDPPAALSPEELRKLKTHYVEVERGRSLALAYHRRNAVR
jgi:hypothetical protein